MRRPLRGLTYAIYLAAFPIGLAYLAWRPFVAELRERERPEIAEVRALGPLSADVMRQVGSYATDRASSFTRFPIEKPLGRRRVCAYGDSFTYGDEVAPDEDFPSQLAAQLASAGQREFEVLNFGSPWHGFQQSFLVWRASAAAMGCDAILLGPGSFYPERDTAFNHSELRSPYYLHARFIETDGQPELVEVLGADLRERMERYFAFVPAWRYLRYDRNSPAALRALVPRDRTLPNPFYYDARSARDEARSLQRALLAEMAAAGAPIALLHPDPEILALASTAASTRVQAAQLPSWREFPLRARLGHMSRAGNALVARAFLDRLLGPATSAGALGYDTRAPEPLATPAVAPRASVSSFDRARVHSGDVAVGEITSASPSHWERGRGTPERFAHTAQRALLFLAPPATPPTDAAIVPLERELAPGAELTLHAAGGAARVLARARPLSARVAVDWAEIPGLEFPDHQQLRWRDPAAAASAAPAAIEIRAAGRPLLRSASDDPARLLPVFGTLLQITATSALAPPRAEESGRWELALARGGGLERVELGRWRAAPIALPAAGAPLFPGAPR
jgi:hypothetical protein